MLCTSTSLPALCLVFEADGIRLAFSALQHQSQLLALVPTVFCRIEYTIEVMKGGASLEKRSVHAKDHYTFGRNPECDFHLEHPSISRVHAVLQYKAEGEHAVLAGSRCRQQKDGGCSAWLRCLCHTLWPLSALNSGMFQAHVVLQYRGKDETPLHLHLWGPAHVWRQPQAMEHSSACRLAEGEPALLDWAKEARMQQGKAVVTSILKGAAVQGRGSPACLVWHIIRVCPEAFLCIARAAPPL